MKFFAKNGTIFRGGSTTAAAPEGDLVFEGLSRVTFKFI
jgi:hypothetical protein